MIPIRQTKDNCMAACWASILEVPLDIVPDYQAIRRAGGLWLNVVQTWLTKHHGVLYHEPERWLTQHITPVGWHLVLVGVPDGDRIDGGHAMVGFNGLPVWDPATGDAPHRFVPASTWGILTELTSEQLEMWRPRWRTCQCGPCVQREPYPNRWAREAACAGCGCTDSRACEGGCSWIHIDRDQGWGVCSNSEGLARSLELVGATYAPGGA